MVHIATQLCILWFYIATCFSLVGHLRGGQKVNRSYRKIVWRFIKARDACGGRDVAHRRPFTTRNKLI